MKLKRSSMGEIKDFSIFYEGVDYDEGEMDCIMQYLKNLEELF